MTAPESIPPAQVLGELGAARGQLASQFDGPQQALRAIDDLSGHVPMARLTEVRADFSTMLDCMHDGFSMAPFLGSTQSIIEEIAPDASARMRRALRHFDDASRVLHEAESSPQPFLVDIDKFRGAISGAVEEIGAADKLLAEQMAAITRRAALG